MEKLLPLREFIYFDRSKVEDFVSALLGGLPSEIKEAESKDSAQVSGKVDLKLISAEGKSGIKNLSWEEIRQATPASLFERLHSLLEKENTIRKVDNPDIQSWDTIQVSDFVEFRARIEFSAIDRIFEMVNSFAPYIATFSPEKMQDPKSQNVLKLIQK